MTAKPRPLPFDIEKAERTAALIRFHADAIRKLFEETEGREARVQYEPHLPLVFIAMR